jgi:hypothetical protein
MNGWQAFGTVAIVAIALGLALAVPVSTHSGTSIIGTSTSYTSRSSTISSGSTTSTSTVSSTSGQTGTTSASEFGLQLQLNVNTTTVSTGQAILVNVTEFNTLNSVNNVTKSSDWQVQGAAISSCPNTNDQPFGIALYQGHYTPQNISQGIQLGIFPITPCPMFERLVTGYVFQPQSDVASILPGSASGGSPMTAGIIVNGTFAQVSSTQAFAPGSYTLAAADEWGALAFLYITVQ